MAAPSAIDGTFGLRIDIPETWEQVQEETLAAVWRTPAGVLVLVSHLPEQVVVDGALLDDYRQDLRLIAAQRGGGLVACELHPTLGVVGLTKEPAGAGGQGVAVVGRALAPTMHGHAALSIVATAGPEARARDSGTAADPYGFAPAPPPDEDGFRPWAWPAELMLAAAGDDPEHDPAWPDHPLTRAREVLGVLRARARRTSPPPVAPSRYVTIGDSLALDLPPGFLAAEQGRLRHGQLFRRVTFEKRVTFLTVCRQPEWADAGRDPARARQLVEQHLAWAHGRALQGPRVVARELAGKPGVFVEHEALIGGSPDAKATAGGHETYSASFFTPWSEDALEVTCFGERDDWARARRTVDHTVGSARSATRPAMVADTTRIAGEVTPAGRRRVYRLLCHLAVCDGEVEAREREALEVKREQLMLDRAEADALEAEARKGERLDLSKNPAEQKLLLEAMIDVVAADGALDHKEQRRIHEIAQLAGIPRAAVAERLLDMLTERRGEAGGTAWVPPEGNDGKGPQA